MTVRPLGHNVLVEPDLYPKETQSGLIMPDSVDEPPMSGKVIGTANGPYRDRMFRNAVITKCLRLLDAANDRTVNRQELTETLRGDLLSYLHSHDDLDSSVREGERVLFPPDAGYTVTLGEREQVFTMLREDYVLGVVEE